MGVNGKIGLALSGGGTRAAAFHLGVLKRLEEANVLPELDIVSAVSGGSIVAAGYALRCAQTGDGRPGSYPVDTFITETRDDLRKNLRGWAYSGTPWRFLRAMVGFLPGRSRASAVIEEFDRRFFQGARLADIPDWLLINATNLQTGKNWKFFSDAAGDYLVGATRRTDRIRLASAVAASAAHPFLSDPVPLRMRWEELREEHLDDRWERPPTGDDVSRSSWRERHGEPRGQTRVQLVDGGIYDNEGVNGLRGSGVDHAVLSSATLIEEPLSKWQGLRSTLRTIAVMHRRLGAITRQFTYEATHGVHPSEARDELRELADRLEGGNHELDIAGQLRNIAEVGWPPRGKQFKSCAMILLHREDVAENRSAEFAERPYDIPVVDRGLPPPLVRRLARVRTDFDAHSSALLDILISQGYFLTDAHLKIGMPAVLKAYTGIDDRTAEALRPTWDFAHNAIDRARSDVRGTEQLLSSAESVRLGLGRSENAAVAMRLGGSALIAALSAAALMVYFVLKLLQLL